MNWLIYTVLSVLCITAMNITQRIAAVKSSHYRTTAVLFNSMSMVMAFILFFATKTYVNFKLPTSMSAWIFIALAMLFYGLFERGRFFVSDKLDAGTYSVVSNVTTIVAFVGSIFLYSESLNLVKVCGALLILLSIFLVSDKSKTKSKNKASFKNIIIGIGISTLLGLGWMLDKKGTQNFGANTYNILLWTLPLIFILFPAIKLSKLIKELKGNFWHIFFPSIFNFTGYWLGLKALETAQATLFITLSQLCIPLTVITGIIFLKERDNVPKKILAGIVAFVGAYLLVAVV